MNNFTTLVAIMVGIALAIGIFEYKTANLGKNEVDLPASNTHAGY